jgi:hypothetical protein
MERSAVVIPSLIHYGVVIQNTRYTWICTISACMR